MAAVAASTASRVDARRAEELGIDDENRQRRSSRRSIRSSIERKPQHWSSRYRIGRPCPGTPRSPRLSQPASLTGSPLAPNDRSPSAAPPAPCTLGAISTSISPSSTDLGHLADQPTRRRDHRVATTDVLDEIGLVLGALLLRPQYHEVHDHDKNGAEQRQILNDRFSYPPCAAPAVWAKAGVMKMAVLPKGLGRPNTRG